MAQKYGPWTIKERDYKYQDSFIDVREDQVLRPDGQPSTYATVVVKPGVAILPIDSDRTVYLVQQFRYALGKESLEVVSGGIEENEAPFEAAQREIQEELGIKAGQWSELGVFDLDTSIIHCPVQLFMAHQLTFKQPDREGTETIETVQIPLDAAVQMVMDSKITHAPSCVLILKAHHAIANS
jgi:8-oxo-dGTP pyrophosphatase MutT (NUDIX family)